MSGTNRPGNLVVKDPQSVNDPFGIDWTDLLATFGDDVEVSSSTWIVSGPDALLTVADDEILTGGQVTQVYLSGGTLGARYTVTNRITTNSSPAVTDDRSFRVLVQQK